MLYIPKMGSGLDAEISTEVLGLLCRGGTSVSEIKGLQNNC